MWRCWLARPGRNAMISRRPCDAAPRRFASPIARDRMRPHLLHLPLLVAAAVVARPLAAQTMANTCQCTACHGVYRWAAKTSKTAPPATIPTTHHVKPSFFSQLHGPGGTFTKKTPRIALEQEWFEVTGRITHVKIEPDGDLHVQLLDRNAPLTASNGYLVVELPEGAPWCAMRAQVLGWTNAHFPLSVPDQGVKLVMASHPVVR